MPRRARLAAAGLVLGVAACGGGSDKPATADSAAPSAEAAPPPASDSVAADSTRVDSTGVDSARAGAAAPSPGAVRSAMPPGKAGRDSVLQPKFEVGTDGKVRPLKP